MKFDPPLIEGTLLTRYKRFLADIQLLDNTVICAHCTNTGSMKEVLDAPQRAWILPAANPKRKLPYTLFALERGSTMIGVHTHFSNTLVKEALDNKVITELAHLEHIRAEVALGTGSRLDFCGETPEGALHYIEVKHVSLAYGTHGFFPDSVTERGTKHIHELRALHAQGIGVTLLFVTQRADITCFSPAWDIDPIYAEALEQAVKEGVQVLVYGCRISADEICIDRSLPFCLRP